MNWDELTQTIGELISDHWMKIVSGILLLIIGRWWGRWRAARMWRKRQFMHRIMISLNSIRNNQDAPSTLAIRTILEKDLKDVLLNDAAVAQVLRAAELTTESDPIVPLPQQDRWYVLNAVLNEVAEAFADGVMQADMGLPVVRQTYIICLTNERAGSVKTQKIRAMVVRKDLLLNGDFEAGLSLESPNHATRIDTLKRIRAAYKSDPSKFLEMEIVMPAIVADSDAKKTTPRVNLQPTDAITPSQPPA